MIMCCTLLGNNLMEDGMVATVTKDGPDSDGSPSNHAVDEEQSSNEVVSALNHNEKANRVGNESMQGQQTQQGDDIHSNMLREIIILLLSRDL